MAILAYSSPHTDLNQTRAVLSLQRICAVFSNFFHWLTSWTFDSKHYSVCLSVWCVNWLDHWWEFGLDCLFVVIGMFGETCNSIRDCTHQPLTHYHNIIILVIYKSFLNSTLSNVSFLKIVVWSLVSSNLFILGRVSNPDSINLSGSFERSWRPWLPASGVFNWVEVKHCRKVVLQETPLILWMPFMLPLEMSLKG